MEGVLGSERAGHIWSLNNICSMLILELMGERTFLREPGNALLFSLVGVNATKSVHLMAIGSLSSSNGSSMQKERNFF